MPSVELKFTLLEETVLRTICETYPRDRAALHTQLSTAKVLRRENTGAGFYTKFTVDRASSPAIGGERLKAGPAVRVSGLDHEMGFILWLREGYAHQLEGYSHGESTTEILLEQATFKLLHE
jgi:hypothetical protein